MTDKRTQEQAAQGNMEKDPADWVTGDEPMTGAQRSYLKTLSEEAREPFLDDLTKAEASRRIEELQARTGRGAGGAGRAGEAAGPSSPEPASPPDEGPAESLGRAVGETVIGAQPPPAGTGNAGRG